MTTVDKRKIKAAWLNLVTTVKHQGIADSHRAVFDALFRLGKPHSWN